MQNNIHYVWLLRVSRIVAVFSFAHGGLKVENGSAASYVSEERLQVVVHLA